MIKVTVRKYFPPLSGIELAILNRLTNRLRLVSEYLTCKRFKDSGKG